MKLRNLVPSRFNGRIIQRFGASQLVRNADGTHDLLGGTREDIAAAKEWSSLFAHDIVFSVSRRQPDAICRDRRNKISPRFRFAW